MERRKVIVYKKRSNVGFVERMTLDELNNQIQLEQVVREVEFIEQQSREYHNGLRTFESLWQPTARDIESHRLELKIAELESGDASAAQG